MAERDSIRIHSGVPNQPAIEEATERASIQDPVSSHADTAPQVGTYVLSTTEGFTGPSLFQNATSSLVDPVGQRDSAFQQSEVQGAVRTTKLPRDAPSTTLNGVHKNPGTKSIARVIIPIDRVLGVCFHRTTSEC